MNTHLRIILSVVVYVFLSCSKHEPEDKYTHIIIWKLNDDANKITYNIDGKPAGEGVKGLENVLAFMDKCEARSKLVFEAPESDWIALDEKYQHITSLATEAFRMQHLGDFSERYYDIVHKHAFRTEMRNLER